MSIASEAGWTKVKCENVFKLEASLYAPSAAGRFFFAPYRAIMLDFSAPQPHKDEKGLGAVEIVAG